MTRTPHQDAIDALCRKLGERDTNTNGNGHQNDHQNGHKGAHAGRPAFVTDAEIIDRCRGAKNAPKFATLYDHGDTGGYRSPSEARMGLLYILAFWTQDAVQIDRLYRGSALHQHDPRKWERVGAKEVSKALDDVTEVYEWPTTEAEDPTVTVTPNMSGNGNARVRRRSQAFSEMPAPEPRRYVVEGLVPESHPTMIYGDGGVAKSLLVLSLGLAVASGAASWLGRSTEAGGVLYLDFELDAAEQMRRVSQLANAEGVEELPTRLRYMSAVGVKAREAFANALEECKEHGVKLLIVDSLGPALDGDAEAARDVIAFYNEVIGPFRAAGVAPLVIDHQSKMQAGERYQSKRAFGSVFKSNLARSVVQVEATDRQDGQLTVRLRQNKHNFGSLLKPFGAHLGFTEGRITVTAVELEAADLADEEILNARERVYLKLGEIGEATAAEIHEQLTDLTTGTVKKELTALKKAGRVEATGETRERQSVVRRTVTVTKDYRGNGNGNGSETDRLEAARAAVEDRSTLAVLAEQAAAGRENGVEALAGGLAAHLGGGWRGWLDTARTLAADLPGGGDA